VDDGDVHEDASITKIDINVWTFPVLVKIARLRTRGDTRVVEGGDEDIADEVMTEGGGARFEDGAAEEVGGAGERLFAYAVAREGAGKG
jgi:hypothetical protein